MLMSWMNGKVLPDPTCQFQLFVDLVQQQIILLSDHAVTIAAVSSEYLESYNIIIYF